MNTATELVAQVCLGIGPNPTIEVMSVINDDYDDTVASIPVPESLLDREIDFLGEPTGVVELSEAQLAELLKAHGYELGELLFGNHEAGPIYRVETR